MRKTEQRQPRACMICGETFMAVHNQIYCHTCATERNKQLSREAYQRYRNKTESEQTWEKVCRQCGKTFVHKGLKQYCPECDTPEERKKRKKASKHKNDIVFIDSRIVPETESYKSKMRKKYAKLVADLVSGARKPRDNHEAIIRIEALGRIHGGMNGSYGKEAAGYYEKE